MNDGADICTTVASHQWAQKAKKFVDGLQDTIECELELCSMDDTAIAEHVEDIKAR